MTTKTRLLIVDDQRIFAEGLHYVIEARASEFEPADVKAVRQRLSASQVDSASMIGVSVATVRNWEQGHRLPEGPARALLEVAARNPQAVVEALSA